MNTEKIRKNVSLGKFIVMPNHIHRILIVNGPKVETHCNASLRENNYKNKFGPQINNLSSIIRGFKGAVTKRIHILGCDDFSWQERFFERVIRDEDELFNIREYIINNPINWYLDRNNPSIIGKKIDHNL
ncbi:transposase [Patescibacteria group bacterium]